MSLKTLFLFCAALVPLTLGCGSGGSAEATDGGSGGIGGNGQGASSTCKFTLSGALTGTYTCYSDPVAGWSEVSNVSSLAFSTDGSPKNGNINIVITHSFIGPLAATTYVGTDPNRLGWAVGVIQNTTLKDWSAASDGFLGNTDGTYSVTISALIPKADVAEGGHTYTIHGSLHAKALAEASSGATGEVTVDGVF
jgi:hypothetical protein